MSFMNQNSTRTYKGSPTHRDKLILSTLSSMARLETVERDKPRLKRMLTKLKKLLHLQENRATTQQKRLLNNKLSRLSAKRPNPSVRNLKRLSTKPKPVLERVGSAKFVRTFS